ncbi:hypothetical protein Btru_076904 [Bulinus truncatus]|nr:hypothetical protein Btru_076904 [Bulinus truncatus]
MSFDTTTLWQNILSRDQRWAPVEYRVAGRSSLYPGGCQAAAKSRQQRILQAKEIQKRELAKILKIKRPHRNPLHHIQSTLNEFKSNSTVCKEKFGNIVHKPDKTFGLKYIDGLASGSNVPKKNPCSGRQRFNHLKGSVLMYPKIKERMKEIGKKYFVADRAHDTGGAKGGLILLPVESPVGASTQQVRHHVVTQAEVAVEEAGEKSEGEEEADGEEEMKADTSEKSWQQAVMSRGCWVDEATISSLGKSFDGARSVSERSGTHDDIFSFNRQGEPTFQQGADAFADDRDALTVTQPTSTTKDLEGSEMSPVPTEVPELPRDKPTGSSFDVTELKTDRSSASREVTSSEATSVAGEVFPPPYICPSSPAKSQAIRVKSWLRQSTFSQAVGTLPMI